MLDIEIQNGLGREAPQGEESDPEWLQICSSMRIYALEHSYRKSQAFP